MLTPSTYWEPGLTGEMSSDGGCQPAFVGEEVDEGPAPSILFAGGEVHPSGAPSGRTS